MDKKPSHTRKTGELLGAELEGVNQILPHMHPWAWQNYLDGAANNWMPTEVPMSTDIANWPKLTDDERLVVKRNLGFFAGSESLVANNLFALAKHITDPECRQYMARQQFEECLHNHTIVYICDSLNLDINEVYEAYANIPSIKAKDDFLMRATNDLNRPDFSTETLEGKRELYKGAFVYWVICEGILFYSGFAMLLSMSDRVPGIAEQIQYTLRDECVKEGTEVLTSTGWIKVEDLKPLTKIAQYNRGGGIEFVQPIRQSISVQDTTYEFSNQENSVSFAVSGNHRLITRNTNPHSKHHLELQEQAAKDFNYHPYVNHLTAGCAVGTVDELTPEQQMMIAIQADGHIFNHGYHNGNRAGYLRVNFTFTKLRKAQRLKQLLKQVGWEYKTSGKHINVNVPKQYCTKEFNDWVNLEDKSSQWCAAFIHETTRWDGWARKDSDSLGYGSTNKRNVDIVQAIAALCGYGTNIITSVDERKEGYKDYHRLTLMPNCTTRGGGAITKAEHHTPNAKFYGFEVPSGMLMIRHNDCVSVTGNSLHIKFGTNLLNTLRKQYPDIMTDAFEQELTDLVKEAVELEIQYAKDVLPRGILSLNSEMFVDYMQYIGNRRLEALGMKHRFNSDKNPFPWLSEKIDIQKQKNFFETRVTDYMAASSLEDDF